MCTECQNAAARSIFMAWGFNQVHWQDGSSTIGSHWHHWNVGWLDADAPDAPVRYGLGNSLRHDDPWGPVMTRCSACVATFLLLGKNMEKTDVEWFYLPLVRVGSPAEVDRLGLSTAWLWSIRWCDGKGSRLRQFDCEISENRLVVQ